MKPKIALSPTRRALRMLLLLCLLPLAWSCNNDDDEKDEVGKIPEGWTQNQDFAKFKQRSWYLYRSGTDSIKLEFYTLDVAASAPYGSMSCTVYQKNSEGEYNRVHFASINEVYSIEKDGKKEIFGRGTGLKVYTMPYQLVNDTTIQIYSLPEWESAQNGMIFKPVSETSQVDKDRLSGKWYHTQAADSTVMSFDQNNIKEQLFAKGSSTASSSQDYGQYTAIRTKAFVGDENLGAMCKLTTTATSKQEYWYTIIGDQLSIYWESPRQMTTYTRIK